ncbi:hypothetical protein P256_00410 [Acinetobacter nectaris CIP 110549]|uniref:HTH marR-type domain-containing protein n=1 Tax=Acinetobacter nectaris CIP 110549 TaxID=1392540 RepID=V2TPM8_9GAMM|nr:MarR family winged helix-turn-helix transcriptional regulator [Acinetobacter nectaris]ESK39971.1 hypothetical protein P256_00410 [Acinetobacter nectaris CIP 110549]MCF8999996.1 winged helix-turn-helix transcriptional regulator [Acinetobacter nectaris]MCF9028377.1 winged helix-turn-helix transcriptional regulator [Acinetobacter nectaris]
MSKKYLRFLPSTDMENQDFLFFHWVTQVHAQYVQGVDHVLKKYGIDHSRQRILNALLITPHASISEISEMLILKMSTTTKIIYRLKNEGLVDTYSCNDDGRITRVNITNFGLDTLNKTNDLTNAILARTFDGLTPLQVEKTMGNLQAVFKNLKY